MTRKTAVLSALCLLLMPVLSQAQETSPAKTGAATATATTTTGDKKTTDKPTDIVADSMEILDKEKRAIFTGNVNLKREDVDWTADKMVIDYEETGETGGGSKTDVKTIDSTGNVKIVTKSQTITGDWAKMDVKENMLKVGGKVKVVQGDSILYGELLDADLDTNKSVMSGGRVKGQFKPK